jgi:hypothetical protein
LYAAKQTAAAAKSRGKAKGGGRSSKAKGRNAVLDVQGLLLKAFPELTPADIFVKATSQGGTDIHLSDRARDTIGLDIEVKCVEALNIWSALKQAEVNSERSGLSPVVFFKRAFTPMYVALPAAMFLAAWSVLAKVGGMANSNSGLEPLARLYSKL